VRRAAGHIVALRDGESYVRSLRATYAERRADVTEALASMPGLTLPDPQGAFYAFPRIEGMTDSAAFTARLVNDTGLALAPGAGFGAAGEGHVRLCFAVTRETLTEALARLRNFLEEQR
jgi:aspartate aminotransferase